ncbi:MAG TPA: hypothetical protein VHW01_02070 [Polyangiaceae bacterium]|nr:hypothetical protein [Polyangiaceae bacterium]
MSALSRFASLLVLTSLSASNAFAAPAETSAPTPTSSAGPSAKKPSPPPAHEAAAQDTPENSGSAMPPSHPGMGSGDAAADVSEAAPTLPPGVISATIVSDQGVPLAGTQVRLGILFQKIAEGESRTEKFAQADSTGTAHFSELVSGSDHAYRVTVQAGAASYQTSPFNLRPEMGQHVVLHVYPSTPDIDKAMIGMRGYMYIETRDDVFQFEVLFRVFNVGQLTWVPKDVVVQLPKGFKAFKAQEGMTDVHFEQVDGVGARFKGTFSPGQNEASFRFQMPKANEDSASFHMTLPPHVAEMRVIAEASSAMNLEVDGFQPPVPTSNQNGQRVLVSVKQLQRRDEELKDFVATLSGIPTPGPGRWVAVLVALCMAIGGVFAARGAFDDAGGGKDAAADKKRAREILLRELIALEAARRAEKIGPRSYDQSRLRLIDAIARLGLPAERPKAGRKSGAVTGTRKRSKSASPRV